MVALIEGLVKLPPEITNWLVTSAVKAALLNIASVLPDAQDVEILAVSVPVPHLSASAIAGAATIGQAQLVVVKVTTLSIKQPAALNIRTV